MSVTKLPIVVAYTDEVGGPLGITGSVQLSVKNLWDGTWIDFSQNPPTNRWPVLSPFVCAGLSYSMYSTAFADPVSGETVTLTPSAVASSDIGVWFGTSASTGTWTYNAGILTWTTSQSITGTITWAAPISSIMQYELECSGLEDGRYQIISKIDDYVGTQEFQVFGGVPVPEVLVAPRGHEILDVYYCKTEIVSGATVSADVYGVRTYIYTADDVCIANAYTGDLSGSVRLLVPSGTFYVHSYKDGYTFPASSVTVTGQSEVAITGSNVTWVSPPSGICVVYGNTVDLGLEPVSGICVSFRLARVTQSIGESIISRVPVYSYTDENGNFQANLAINTTVLVEADELLKRYQITIPDQASANIIDLIP